MSTSIGIGVLLGALLVQWAPVLWILIGVFVILLSIYIFTYVSRYSFRNLEKGLDAESRIGQVIEYALVQRNCAFAHGVTEIVAWGDIDHLVATPAALWVIETKHRKVPESKLSTVLNRISENVRSVQEWAPGIPVNGCLVFHMPPKGKLVLKAPDGTTVTVYDENSLVATLRGAIRESGPVDSDLAHRIWALGRTTV